MSEDGYCTCDGDSEVAASCGLRRHREPALARRNPSPDLSGGAVSPAEVAAAHRVLTPGDDNVTLGEIRRDLASSPDREALHFPAVAEAGDGWGVYCAACSDAAQEYVYPCERGRAMPPARLVDPVPLLAENERLAARLSGLRIDVATLRAERDALRLVADSWSALESKAAAERDEVKAERDALAAKIERLRDRPRAAEMPPGPLVRDTDGPLTVEWPLGRGEWFAMTPQLFESLVEDLNTLRAENERLRAALAIALSHLGDPRCAEVRTALNTPEGEK